MGFHVGQFVVHILGAKRLYSANYPEPGCIYTVRDSFKEGCNGRDLILLEEVVNQPRFLGCCGIVAEQGFAARWFRPVDETRIAIFRQALTSVPTKLIPAEAIGPGGDPEGYAVDYPEIPFRD